MGTYIEPFDLYTILVNYFLGNASLLIFFAILLISATCGYYQMSNRNYLLIMAISLILLGRYIGEAILFLVLLIAGIIIFKMMSSFAK